MLDLSAGQPGCIPQAVADAWASARVVGVLAAVSLPFIRLGRRVAARGAMSRTIAIIMVALAPVFLLSALWSALVSFSEDPFFSGVPAAFLAIAICLATCGGIGLRRRSAAKEPERLRGPSIQPVRGTTEAGDADLGTLETDALVEMLRDSRDHEERERLLLELQERGAVDEM